MIIGLILLWMIGNKMRIILSLKYNVRNIKYNVIG